MSKRGLLIAVSGVDGSGKTTVISMLMRILSDKYGIDKGKVIYVWCKYEYKLIKPLTVLGRIIFLRNSDPLKNYNDYCKKRKSIFRNPLVARMYRVLMDIDYAFQILINIKIPLLLNKIVICDRYIIDTALELYFDYDLEIEDIVDIINKYYKRMAPKPDIQLILDIDEEEAMRRKNDVPHIDYIRERRYLYNSLAGKLNINVLYNDTLEKAEQIAHYLADKIFALLKQYQQSYG